MAKEVERAVRMCLPAVLKVIGSNLVCPDVDCGKKKISHVVIFPYSLTVSQRIDHLRITDIRKWIMISSLL